MNKPSPQAVPEPEGETQGAAVTTTQLDPFSPANLRLSQSFTETVRVEKLLTTVPVRKPGPLHTAINRQGIVFFWPVRLPSSDGRDMNWWKSAREAAALATREWDSR